MKAGLGRAPRRPSSRARATTPTTRPTLADAIPPADCSVERIGDLLDVDLDALLDGAQRRKTMNANTRKLHELGQSLWLDNITREHARQTARSRATSPSTRSPD